MPDLSLSVTVSRTLLGLSALDINDHTNYYIADTFLSGQIQFNRTQATSPYIDGAVTVARTRQMVTENITIEVLGDTSADLKTNIDTLVDAFLQDSFTLTVVAAGTTYSYNCEAADYQLNWVGSRMIARQVQVVLSVPRQPAALSGTV